MNTSPPVRYAPQPVTLTVEVFAPLTATSNAERAALWHWKRSGHDRQPFTGSVVNGHPN